MALDSWSNTGLSTLASGIDASQTTLTVATGTGSRFPAANFQLVIWQSTDFANPIDASDREIVRCTSRSGDVLTIVRGQEGTSGVAHNTGGKTYSVALIVSQKFRDDLQAGHEIDGNLKFKSGTSFSGEFDHANSANRTWGLPNYAGGVELLAARQRIYTAEDFWAGITPDGFTLNIQSGAVTHEDTAGGVVRLEANAVFYGTRNWISAAKNPVIKIRYAPSGSDTVILRRQGVSDSTTTPDPTNGIFVRHTNAGGNIIAVARASSVESTLDTGVATAADVFHDVELQVRGGNSVVVFVDGVENGTISSNVPTVLLHPWLTGGDSTVTTVRSRIDYITVSQER